MAAKPEREDSKYPDLFTQVEVEMIEKGIDEISEIQQEMNSAMERLEKLEFRLKSHVQAVREHFRRIQDNDR